MKKVAFAVTVLALAGVLGCAARKAQEPQSTETPAAESGEAQESLKDCHDKEMRVVNDSNQIMRFEPAKQTVCRSKKLSIKNELGYTICVELTKPGSLFSIQDDVIAGGKMTLRGLPTGPYEVSACALSEAGSCDAGCPAIQATGDNTQTIKGNLVVTSGGGTQD